MPPTNVDLYASQQAILNDVWDENGHFLRLSVAGLTGTVAKTITFTGAAGNGATGTVALFTVTGTVLMDIIAVSSTTPVGASATIAVGIAGATARYLPQTTATTITTGKTLDLSGLVTAGTAPNTTPNQVGFNGDAVIATVATANITAGVLTFYCFYRALSSDGKVA